MSDHVLIIEKKTKKLP